MNQYVAPETIETAQSLHDTFADVLVAWGEFEEKQPSRKLSVQNLIAHRPKRSYQNMDSARGRDAVRADLLKLHSGFLRAGDVSAAARVRSFVAYLDTLKDQNKYSLREYYARMTGLDLKPFTPEQIAEVKNTLMICMAAVQKGFSESDFSSLEKVLHGAEPELSRAEFEAALDARLQEDKSTIKRLTGLNPSVPYHIDIRLLPKGNRAEAGWENNFIRVSLSQQLTTYRMIAHEIDIRHEVWGHGLQVTQIAEAVNAGKLPRSYGVMTTTGSEIMHSEAMAECVSRLFVPTGQKSALSQASHWYLMHRRMTGFNARLICAEKGEAAARAYLVNVAPYMQKKDIDVLIVNMSTANRPNVHYPLVYAPVHYALNRFAHAVGPHTFGKFIGEVLPTLMDAEGLNKAMERYAGSSRYNLPIAP
ncbi:MAG: hypothetical protein EBQ96_04215 [Proteobacteria bacterium]|nr:hypothetical protein [Pseudomonadota bacterium]